MSDPFPTPARGPEPEEEKIVQIDPTREQSRWRWEIRAAQWRARELAEAVFGGAVGARLTGRTPRGAFHGLLHLEVPFENLDTHRSLEAVFLASAARDPLLGGVPLVFVLSPLAR